MKNEHKNKAPQNADYSEVVFQEKEIGEAIPNQWSLKLKKVESVILPAHVQEQSSSKEMVDIKKSLILKKDGTASITFDTSTLKKYTIFVINESKYTISAWLELSPNNLHFVKTSIAIEVKANMIEILNCDVFVKFVKVHLQGKDGSTVIVCLQGMD